ncbi:MAG: tRNA (adenosine(37)-N6)-dimethylallyltransferase MiaA [bacterium]|nr:tRNA (adenosine(37)-N6)-dimethylallyltransferase MiaA [bacterium]
MNNNTVKRKAKIIIIIGPTASGKSELAVALAKRFRGEIISADSRQVYIGLNIGTGKVPGKWLNHSAQSGIIAPMGPSHRAIGRSDLRGKSDLRRTGIFAYKGIRHYCIDFVSPRKVFTAEDFKTCAEKTIKDILSRGKIPIIVGGTGFYIDAVVYGMGFPLVPPNKKLRLILEQKGLPELILILKKLDSARLKMVDKKNPHRLIRAIEIAKALGHVPKLKKRPIYQALWLGIKLPKDELSRRIHIRLIQRMREGMVKEAQSLHKHGLGWKRFYELGLEYKYLADFLRGEITKNIMLKNLETAIRHYARRQMVWFKRNPEIHWIKNKKGAERVLNISLGKKKNYRELT